eukprot:scaffold67403_cov31-Attheya_sp.AAC.1
MGYSGDIGGGGGGDNFIARLLMFKGEEGRLSESGWIILYAHERSLSQDRLPALYSYRLSVCLSLKGSAAFLTLKAPCRYDRGAIQTVILY